MIEPGAAVLRPAVATDVPAILERVRDLADYEGDRERITATVADYREALFPPDGAAKVSAHVAERSGEIAGVALWYDTFSTWTGRHSTRLVDLFVAPEHRELGLGKALVRSLGQRCLEQDRARLVWLVATWNTAAIAFYERLGARPDGTDEEYHTYVLDRAGMAALVRP